MSEKYLLEQVQVLKAMDTILQHIHANSDWEGELEKWNELLTYKSEEQKPTDATILHRLNWSGDDFFQCAVTKFNELYEAAQDNDMVYYNIEDVIL